jgi:hypothetical protein
MIDRSCLIRRFVSGICVLAAAGCSHRQGSAAVAVTPAPVKPQVPQMLAVMPPVTVKTFTGPGIQFDYPADWKPTRGNTALFAVSTPDDATAPVSISLDVPKLPWHIPGMISVGMVASGYVSDLKKNQMPDAVIKEQSPVNVCGETGKRVTCTGHVAGKFSTDIAVFLVHNDRVYILSADANDTGCDCARKTLNASVASMKWIK